jgi:iron complex outermembrane receptor protein
MVAALLTFMALEAQDTLRDSTRLVRLTDLEVTVARRRDSLASLPMAASVIPRYELTRAQPTIGLDEALTLVPGVFVANRWNFSLDQRLSIRGFGSRANFGLRGVKVYLDGVPQTLPDGQSQLTNVELATLERVEVLRGASSALYGNASGGALVLESAAPSSRPTSGFARIQGGSFDSHKWLLGGTFRSDRWSGGIQLSRFVTDGFRQHSAAEARQAAGTLRYVAGRTIATLKLALADNPEAKNPGALTAAELAVRFDSAAGTNITRGADKQVSQQQASLRIDQQLGQSSLLSVTGFALWRSLDNPLATPPPGPPTPTAGTWNGIDREGAGVRVELTAPMGPRLRATGGFDLQAMNDERENQRAEGGVPTGQVLLRQRERVVEAGPFAQLRWQAAPRLTIDAGARYDFLGFDVDDRFLEDGIDHGGYRRMHAVSGNLGAAFEPASGFSVYGLVSTSFETPTTTELVNQTGTSAGFNPDLDPQRAVNFEIGFRGRRGAVELTATGFVTRVRDAIIQVREVSGRAFFDNAGRTRNLGLELGLGVTATRGVTLTGAYTWADYEFTDYVIVNGAVTDTLTGNQLAGVPRHFVRVGARLGPLRGLTLDVDQLISSSLFADDANTIRVDGWGAGVTNARLAWSGAAERFRVVPFLTVQNLFDRRYVGSVTINGFGGRVLEPSPGRHAFVGMEISLGGL